MMFADRERDFENRYAHDQELRFRIEARRNKLMGLWAAGRLGLTGAEAESYAQDVVRMSFLKPGDNDVLDKIKADLDRGQVEQSEPAIRQVLAEMLAAAETQIMTE